MKPYPLLLEPIFKEKVWGGRRLEALGKRLPDGATVGESWELADLASTSPDGGGGESAHSRISNGEMRGLLLNEAVTAWGPNLMGSLRSAPQGGFPLLLKYLDARDNLSVQVHPSPAYAQAHPGAHLKTESWFVVDADPGAVIYKGIRMGVTRDAFAAKLRAGMSIVEDMVAVPVKAGDFHHLPSGTCHALGAGLVIAEIQTPSDTTFRVWDWGRRGRALHVEPALECIHFGPPQQMAPARSGGGPRTRLVEAGAYQVFELDLPGGHESVLENVPPFPEGGPMAWMVVRGEGAIEDRPSGRGASYRPVEFRTGSTILFPASLGPASYMIKRDTTILEVRFPAPA